MTPGILVEGVALSYRRGGRRALDGVSLTVQPGEALGIIGPNGAGKTTLFGCLLGHLRPDAGTITFDGRSPDTLGVKAEVGFLPERLMFDRWMTGREFLGFHHALAGLPDATRPQDVNASLDRVGLDHDAASKRVKAYSRGMLQRIGLAQALIARPRYLFLDEPASGVDPAGVLLFRRILADARAGGTTILLNSHQLEQVERICDRVVFLREGKVTAMEVLHAGAEVRRHLRVRFAAGPNLWQDGAANALATAAAAAGATVETRSGNEAVCGVPDDAGATRLLRALLDAGLPVVEARSEEGRLERLFLEPASGGGAA